MSTITQLSVNSSPEIRFRWEGTGGQSLVNPADVDALTNLQASTVAGAGVARTDGAGPPFNLAGWNVSQFSELVAGIDYEVILTPPAGLSFAFQTGQVVTITFTLATSVDGARQTWPFTATATVDAPYGQVINAISSASAAGQQELGNVTGFPLQVYDTYAMPSGGAGVGASTSSAQAMVDAQMKAVLGRSTGSGGVAATLAALDRSFQTVVADGVDTWVWQPQSYAVQSDIGAGVTGEQASLARLATSVGDEILPLIGALTPLMPEARVNPDEIAATQSIISEAWPALATELGSDAGPRISRAKRLLEDVATQLVTVGILLGMYQRGTSLDPRVNRRRDFLPNNFKDDPFDPTNWPVPDRANGVVTGDDEANYTNFIIACDRVQVVMAEFNRTYIANAVPDDRGFLVTVLQRSLEAAGEAADAVYGALDSVNLGRDEREVIYVPGTDPSNPPAPDYRGPGSLSVEDIVSWAAEFPGQEASSLLQNGGNIGVGAIVSRVSDIQRAVAALQVFAQSGGPPGLAHPRVTNALQLLLDAFGEVITYAGNAGLGYTQPVAP